LSYSPVPAISVPFFLRIRNCGEGEILGKRGWEKRDGEKEWDNGKKRIKWRRMENSS